jgi:hypothetical protein
VFVRKLRQKLRTASPEWSYIHTHFGVGYRFAPEADNGQVPEGDERHDTGMPDVAELSADVLDETAGLDPAFAG